MNIQGIISVISLILAPVVMVSCCVLFLNGQLQRYDALANRIRTMNQERFTILREVDNDMPSALEGIDGFRKLRVQEIETQLPHLLRRHLMLHRAALTIGLAVLICILSMFFIAISVLLKSPIIAIIALCTFLTATITILLGGGMIMFELYLSHLALRYEVMHELSLGAKATSLTKVLKWRQTPHNLRWVWVPLKK
ncbi:MAG TPA: DUF2721 domain-containing protein [Ktedonobacteraceae bacterium]|jgi:hypothetical protein